ncbi:MAG: hypothetical protein LBH37_04880 [Oscillospiraceae bacterium]|jgi:hypothetical protein|nr:hypothetical protein [Oscillospiraceae bacterium]
MPLDNLDHLVYAEFSSRRFLAFCLLYLTHCYLSLDDQTHFIYDKLGDYKSLVFLLCLDIIIQLLILLRKEFMT